MRLPPDVETIDQLVALFMRELEPDDCFRVMKMLEAYEGEARDVFLRIGRREVLIEIRQPSRN